MGLAITGALMIAYSLTIRIVALRAISRSPKATPTPWTWTLRAPMMWAGVVLLIGGINQTAGAIALAIGMIVLTAVLLRMLINAPTATRHAWRTIGDPAAWRGETTPDAGTTTPHYFGRRLWHKIALGVMAVVVLVLIATLAAPR